MLSRDDILGISDIQTKEVYVPVWDKTLLIKQLTRGQQDEYLKRQFGRFGLKGSRKEQGFESDFILFGHDAWLFVQGVCDDTGKRLFTNADVEKIAEKNGEAVGLVAKEIIDFSGMSRDVKELDEIKNS